MEQKDDASDVLTRRRAETDGGTAARPPEGLWDFFVSYTQADRDWAEWIAWQLESAGYRVLVQAWDFVPGTHWMARMQEGMQGARRILAVLSGAYLQSVYGNTEWQAAYGQDPDGFARRLIPVRVEDCDRPALLRHIVSLDLFPLSEGEAREFLLARIGEAVSGRAKPAAEPTFPDRTAGGRPRAVALRDLVAPENPVPDEPPAYPEPPEPAPEADTPSARGAEAAPGGGPADGPAERGPAGAGGLDSPGPAAAIPAARTPGVSESPEAPESPRSPGSPESPEPPGGTVVLALPPARSGRGAAAEDGDDDGGAIRRPDAARRSRWPVVTVIMAAALAAAVVMLAAFVLPGRGSTATPGDGGASPSEGVVSTPPAPTGSETARASPSGSGPTGTTGTHTTASITTSLKNDPPTAALRLDKTSGDAPLTVAADGSGSRAGSHPLSTYDFSFGGVVRESGDGSASYTFESPGTYTVTLTVIDATGTRATSQPVTVTVRQPLTAPVLIGPADRATFFPGDKVTYSWNAVAGADSYVLLFEQSSGSGWQMLAPYQGTAPSYSMTWQGYGAVRWRVSAARSDGTNGPMSEWRENYTEPG